MPLHVLDCPGLPAHTCVWGRLPHNVSALANLLQEMPTKPSATSICSMTELLEAYTWLAPPITTRTWACDLAAGMSGNSVESTLNQICFKYASPMVIVLHTRLLMAKAHECHKHCMDLPLLASKPMMCDVCKSFQPHLSAVIDLTGRRCLRRTHPTLNPGGKGKGYGALNPSLTMFEVPTRCLKTCWTCRTALPKLIVSITC